MKSNNIGFAFKHQINWNKTAKYEKSPPPPTTSKTTPDILGIFHIRIKKFMSELLFWTNLVSNIGTKTKKRTMFNT